jgi:butanol dehydrogenase
VRLGLFREKALVELTPTPTFGTRSIAKKLVWGSIQPNIFFGGYSLKKMRLHGGFMLDFDYNISTKVLFGQKKVLCIGDEIKLYGSRVLLVYGASSIKKNGIYEIVTNVLKDGGIYFKELSGVQPNPRIASVREGISLCRDNDLDFILAVGGGSVIDCAKAIACGFFYQGDPWDFFINKAQVDEALPIGTVLTLSATGSEMNGFAVISNPELKEKLPAGADVLRPRFSVLDPTYTFTVNRQQTAAGVVDIFVHILEQYFSHQEGTFVQDRMAEALVKTCIHYGKKAIEEPHDYQARANLMWASSLALNGLLTYGKVGDWATHCIEHSVSAVYDVTHGVGLAVIAPFWMDYVLDDKTCKKLAEYSRNVWSVEKADDFEAAKVGIKKTREFFSNLGMPADLSSLGVDKSTCRQMAQKTTVFGEVGSFKKLNTDDVEKILINAC